MAISLVILSITVVCVCVGRNAAQVFIPFSVSCRVGFRLQLLDPAETLLLVGGPGDIFSPSPF